MTSDDRTTQALLGRMHASEPAGTVADVAAVTATDQHGAIELTLDASRRISAVHVHDVSAIRTPETFTTALIGAFQSADGDRALAALERSGRLDEFLDRAEREHAEHPGLRRPARPDVSYDAYRSGRLHGRSATRAELPAARTSDNGYLTVQRGPAGDLLTVQVDPEWLLGARREHLEAAIEQATTITTDGE
jgi:hypothetical protein